MAHKVETMAYTNEVPWHGLGTYIDKAPSVAAMLKAAGLDWKIEKIPLIARKNSKSKMIPIDDNFALVRDKDQQVLSIVGADYNPVQNTDAFKFFKDFVEAGDATMETAGSLMGGQLVWGLAKLKMDFMVSAGDSVRGHVLLASPHTPGKALIAKSVAERVVCHNTYQVAMNEGGTEFRMTHRSLFDKNMIKKAQQTLGLAREQINEFEANAKLLHKMKMDEKDAIKMLAPIISNDEEINIKAILDDFEKEAALPLKKVMGAYKNAPGAEIGTGWGVLNAVTYYADHLASRTTDKRLSNAWFGKTSRMKTKTMEALLVMNG